MCASKKVALVDLDGIILEYDGWKGSDHFSDVKKGAREGLSKLKKLGYDIVVWTTRGNSQKVAEHLKEKQIPFDYVNHHPENPSETSRKLYGDLIIDDRALGCPEEWFEIIERVRGETGG